MSFFAELKRRNVFKVGVAYIIVAWLLIQVVSIIVPAYQAPAWVMPIFITLISIGFPLALILAWAFELTPEGIKITASEGPDQYHTRTTGQQLNYLIIGVLVLAVGFLVVDNYVLKGTQNVTEEVSVSPPATKSVAPAATPVQEEELKIIPNSIAVLPLENLSPDKDKAYFAAGMHEEILNQLAKLKHLSVISRTSVLRYANDRPPIPQIAKELNVEAVMEGSVQFDGENVLVQAQLIDAATDTHIWSERYERKLAGVFEIQKDIAMNVANAMAIEYSQEEQARLEKVPTQFPEAYDFVLKARQVLTRYASEQNPNLLEIGLSLLEDALRIDPGFADAYALRAFFYIESLGRREPVKPENWLAHRIERETLARRDVEQALLLDPDLTLAHQVLGRIQFANRNYKAAMISFRKALELSPSDETALGNIAIYSAMVGEFQDAVKYAKHALRPNDALRHHFLGIVLLTNHDYSGAYNAFSRAAKLNPSMQTTRLELSRLEIQRGNIEQAMVLAKKYEELKQINVGQAPDGDLAYTYALAGKKDEAMRVFKELEARTTEDYISPLEYSLGYLAIGDHERALQELEIAASSWNLIPVQLMYFKYNVFKDPVLEQPEFKKVRNRMLVNK